MVMINGIVIFTTDLKFVHAQLLVCERQSILPAELAVHGHTVQVDDHIAKTIDRDDREREVIYAMYAMANLR